MREIIGVIDFVRSGDHNVANVNDVVADLLIRADSECVLPVPEPRVVSRYRSGDRVRISGASVMAGQVGIFQRILAGTSAIVDLDWMGRMVPIMVDERDLVDGSFRKKKRRKRYPGRRTLQLAAAAA